MAEKFEQYTDVLNRLVSETIFCTPQEWTKGTLTIVTDGARIDYKLKNEDEPGIAQISEVLRDLIDELYVRMNHHGDTWVEAKISFFQSGNGAKFDTKFKYASKSEPICNPVSKPWWKVW